MTKPADAAGPEGAPTGAPAGGGSLAFDFGENWDHFSRDVLDAARLQAAADSLAALVGAERVAGASVCDVGSGSGLFSLAAAKLGAGRVLGFDVNPRAVAVARRNLAALAPETEARVSFTEGSALDAGFTGGLGRFDLVYAWGSLHHTGAMWTAIANAAALVAPGGTLVLALYNRHWTSPVWTGIKVAYNLCPRVLRPVPNVLFGGLIYAATRIVTGKSPLTKERGMDFWYDVIDWLGGYPYEYAGAAEVTERMAAMGFATERVLPPRVPTGCNEFVLRRTG
ncbi:class I SAM-dependent methyltransferase [Azospirillum oleiclasticum]|uniref:class I SAM-dependent methyltransferase n=1 Tax=Azospirillum oleiclasticum TaxID=2735135 RepID=UPI0031B58809